MKNDTRERQSQDISIRQKINQKRPEPQAEQFSLTLLADARLWQRLCAEIHFVAQRLRLNWPNVKKDPIRFITTELGVLLSALKRRLSQPQMALGLSTSVVLLVSLLAGCTVGPKYVKPAVPTTATYKEEAPASFKETDQWHPARPGDQTSRGSWWPRSARPRRASP